MNVDLEGSTLWVSDEGHGEVGLDDGSIHLLEVLVAHKNGVVLTSYDASNLEAGVVPRNESKAGVLSNAAADEVGCSSVDGASEGRVGGKSGLEENLADIEGI